MKRCFLFPGQGAQYPGMAKDLYEKCESVRNLFQLASDATGMNLTRLLFEGTEEELKQTDNTQVAVTLAALAARRYLSDQGIFSEGTAGFSLGEYSALVDAGVLTETDTLTLVHHRGRIMQEAADALTGDGNPPGMAAVLGLSLNEVSSALEGLEAYTANYNAPTQIAISGTDAALTAAEELLKEKGARRVIRLKVSAPFHSPLLQGARDAMEDILADVSFRDPEKTLYSNATGVVIHSGAEARDLCLKQITSTVLWVREEEAIIQDGFEQCLEVGPGKVLTGLWKSGPGEIPCYPSGTAEDIKALLEE